MALTINQSFKKYVAVHLQIINYYELIIQQMEIHPTFISSAAVDTD